MSRGQADRPSRGHSSAPGCSGVVAAAHGRRRSSLFYTLTDVPRPRTLPLPQVATIQYSDGSTLARIGDQDRTIVHLDQVPEQVRYDVLAAEDRGFYSEPGVSITGTLRAAFTDLTGGDTQGGSGITQQYVKNAYLNDSRTLTRKLKELMIAVKLAREYTKDQILEFYLNTVYFGRGAYGIQAAAQAFFGEDVSKLNVAQGALLAGAAARAELLRPGGQPGAGEGALALRPRRHGDDQAPHPAAGGGAAVSDGAARRRRPTAWARRAGSALIVQRVLAELAGATASPQDEIYKRGLHDPDDDRHEGAGSRAHRDPADVLRT